MYHKHEVEYEEQVFYNVHAQLHGGVWGGHRARTQTGNNIHGRVAACSQSLGNPNTTAQ